MSCNFDRCNLEEEYLFFLNSEAFIELCDEPSITLDKINNFNFSPSLIVRSRNFGHEFLTIDRLKSFNQQKWLSIDDIDSSLIEEYQSNFKDPYWTN